MIIPQERFCRLDWLMAQMHDANADDNKTVFFGSMEKLCGQLVEITNEHCHNTTDTRQGGDS